MQSSIQANKADISGQVDKILAFPVFNNSQVLSGFLRFIVDETLEGREKSLKEYTIGTRVLSKKTSYDPQVDASVRIHAGRLRRALYDYYNGPGSNDAILISVPKGSYIPKIESISATVKQASDNSRIYFKPTLAVLPFHVGEDMSLRALGDGLCDQLCTELSHFNELAVVSYYSSRKVGNQIMDVGEAGAMLDAEYVLTGSIQSAGNIVRIRVQLIQTNSHHQIWANFYEKESMSMNTFTIQDDVVRHVVNQIAGSHGIIFRETIKSTTQKGVTDIKVYDAVYWYYHLVNNLNQEVFHKALKSVQEAVQLDPQYALGWAILGEMCVAGTFYRYHFEVERPLEEAVKYCREALRIDQRCDHAYQALALAYLFQHKPEDCLKTIEQWLKLKSNAASVAGGLGFCLICLGQYQRGYDLLNDSIQLNPYYPWWFNAGLSIDHFRKGEFGEAIYWAEKMQQQSVPWELILKAVAYAEMDNPVRAKMCLEELSEFFPDTPHEQKAYLSTFLQDQELVERLWATLRKIGRTTANG